MTNQLTLEQSLQDIFPTLPAPIQRFIKEGKPGEVAQTIMDHYVLHIDQGTIIEHQILLALFGVVGPEEFMEALSDKLSLSDDVVGDIIEDVNNEVFMPLREEMRKGPQTVPQIPKPVAVAEPPRTSVLSPRTTIIPSNPQLPQRPAQMLTSVPRYVPPKKYFNLQNKIPPPVTPTLPVLKQADSNRLLEDHEEPHIEFKKTASPPPNLPGVIQPTPILQPPAQPTPPVPPPAPVESYSTDPYREPVE